MAMKKRYHTVNGMLIGETSNGVRRGYLPDALGSVVATVDNNGSIENTYRYKPYGSLLAKTGTAADPRFMWIGGFGSRTTTSLNWLYNRRRHLSTGVGAWSTQDPVFHGVNEYIYARGAPTILIDPSGLVPLIFQACAYIGGWRSIPGQSPYMPLLAEFNHGGLFIPIGLNTNGRNYMQNPLDCKMFLEVSIDSCAIGHKVPTYFSSAGVSRIAWLRPFFGPYELFSGRGKVVITPTPPATSKAPCKSLITVNMAGYAAAPLIRFLPMPIILDVEVTFTAGADVASISYKVLRRTQFPDFEFRLNIGGLRNFDGVKSRHKGPEVGLNAPTVPGPSSGTSGYVPTPKCCRGSCP